MGGLEAFTFDVCKRLQSRGHDVSLHASADSDPSLNLKPILCDKNYNHITGSRFTSHDLCQDFITTHHAYVELMQEIDEQNYDIIFNNCLNYVPIMMASVIKTPIVTVLHTPPIFELKKAITCEQIYGDVKYVTVSETNAQSWEPYVQDCQVIQNGIDLKSWKFYPDNQEDYLIWFGRIHPDKGTHIAIQAAQKAGKRLKVVGTISDHDYYNMHVKPLLDDTIEMVGHCDHEQLNVLIGRAEVCLITPCWDEPFGLVVAEALACGTPVAGISRGALPQILDKFTGCLTSSVAAEDLAICIHNASRLNRQDCRKRAEETLDVELMMDSYEKLLTSKSRKIPFSYAV